MALWERGRKKFWHCGFLAALHNSQRLRCKDTINTKPAPEFAITLSPIVLTEMACTGASAMDMSTNPVAEIRNTRRRIAFNSVVPLWSETAISVVRPVTGRAGCVSAGDPRRFAGAPFTVCGQRRKPHAEDREDQADDCEAAKKHDEECPLQLLPGICANAPELPLRAAFMFGSN